MAGPTCWVLEAPIEMRQRAPAWSRLGARRAPALFVPRQPCGLDVCVRRNVLLAADRPWLFGAGRRCSRAVNTNRWNSSSRPDAPIILPVWSAHRHRRGCIRPPLMMVENATACTSSASTTSITRLRVRATQKPPPSLSGSTKKGWSLWSGWRKTAGPQGRDTPD